jgi:hypothetical protein
MAYPWHATRANLGEGDYQLLDPRAGAPLPHFAAIETKRKDLVSSLTWGHDRLEAEFARLAPYRFKALVATVSMECIVGSGPGKQPTGAVGKEASLVGSILALSWDYRVPIYCMPNVDFAEYIVAFLLARAWKVALSEDGGLLTECRRLEALERATGGVGQERAGPASSGLPPGMEPIAKQMKADEIGRVRKKAGGWR